MTPQDLAPVLYDSYATDRGWTRDFGYPMPTWPNLTTGEQSHWCAVAETVLDLGRQAPTPALDHLAELLVDPEAESAWGRPIAAALVELADMLRARRPQ